VYYQPIVILFSGLRLLCLGFFFDMTTQDMPHGINYTEEVHRRLEKIAAILDLADTKNVWVNALEMYEEYAKKKIKGNEQILVSPELAEIIRQNPDFFQSLTEHGLVEWLTPLVRSKPLTREAP
jgi:hypothetical protein